MKAKTCFILFLITCLMFGTILSTKVQAASFTDIFFLKYTDMSNTAELELEKKWCGIENDRGTDIFISDEKIYVSGDTSSYIPGEKNFVILKYDILGNISCWNTWGGEYSGSPKLFVSQNSIYMAGTTYSFGYENAVLVKFDSECNYVWHKLWGNPSYQGGYDNYKDLFVAGKKIYCVGNSEWGFGNPRLILHCYDKDGSRDWITDWGPFGWNIHTGGEGITVLNNHIYIAGYTQSGSNVPTDALIMKYDTSGNLLWERTWGGTGFDYAQGVTILGDDIFVVGFTGSYGAGGDDIFLLKYSSSGEFKWEKTFGGSEQDRGFEIAIANDHIYITGNTKSYGNGGSDAIILKTDLSGNEIWNKTWGGTGDDFAKGLYVVGDKIYIAGDTPEPPNKGDFNSDGCVDKTDLNIILADIRDTSQDDPSHDLNCDGSVNIADARYLVTLFTNPQGAPCD